MSRKSSFVHGRANVEKLERAARALLGLPNEATRTYCYAIALDDDPESIKAQPSARTIAALEHPTRKGEYQFPDHRSLRAALANPVARARADDTALAALDDHATRAVDLPAEWEPAP